MEAEPIKYLTIKQAALKANLSQRQIYHAVEGKELAHFKFGTRKAIRIDVDDLLAWIESKRVKTKQPRQHRRKPRECTWY